MSPLSATALASIRGAGFTRPEWVRMWGYSSGVWGGDRCGCFDDRCIGHHHEGADGCGCLETMISDAVAWRTATRDMHAVELVGGPYGLFQWVDVKTPAARVNVSTSVGSVGPVVNGKLHERAPQSSISIETVDGWTSAVTFEERDGVSKMVIRFTKMPAATGQAEKTS